MTLVAPTGGAIDWGLQGPGKLSLFSPRRAGKPGADFAEACLRYELSLFSPRRAGEPGAEFAEACLR